MENGGEIIQQIADRAENYYQVHGLCCSEAILLVLNKTFSGGLDDADAIRVGSGFCGGMGDGQCTCGALSGAMAGLGVLLGPGGEYAVGRRKIREVAKHMQRAFREQFGATRCHDLIADIEKQRREKKRRCQGITGKACALAVEVLLAYAPGAVEHIDHDFLAGKDTRVGVLLSNLAAFFREGKG